MDVILGIKVKDAVIVATSKAVSRGISIIGSNDDKTRALSDHTLLAYTGEAGDTGK
jgi:20S proteasome subunit beta 4